MSDETAIVGKSRESAIEFTDSLSAFLIEPARFQYEHHFAHNEADVARCTTALKQERNALGEVQNTTDEQVAANGASDG